MKFHKLFLNRRDGDHQNRLKPLYLRQIYTPESAAGYGGWRHEGQRQYSNRWYGLGGEESSSTAIIQALSPDGETVPSRRHNQTDSESGEEANEADTEECRSRLLLFFGLAPTDNTKVMQAAGVD